MPAARLEALAEAAEAYVDEAFGQRLNLVPIAPTTLPHFMLDRYQIWQGSLNGLKLLVVAIKEILPPGSGATAQYLKHRDRLRDQVDIDVVLLLVDHAPNALRRQMMERKIGFIAPGAQLYVPEAFLDLRERVTAFAISYADHISPTTQYLLMALLHRLIEDDQNLTELADRLCVSIMSISRTLDELEALQLAKAHHAGRQRRLHMLLGGRELWDAVQARLQSPIRKLRNVAFLDGEGIGPLAGESALAHYTMLAPPKNETRAVLAASWKRLAETHVARPATAFDSDAIAIQTWTYDPRLLAKDGVVDRLSLYLTVRDHRDERVAQAADELLETFAW
ncbi:MAG: MarR family transcriptional regulator [Usitatibacteraceae bacterium]